MSTIRVIAASPQELETKQPTGTAPGNSAETDAVRSETLVLTDTHRPLLEKLSMKPIDDEWLAKANRLVRKGSETMRSKKHDSDGIIAARDTF